MIALYKPERATYSQAVEAQQNEYFFVDCDSKGVVCKHLGGPKICCI